MWNIFGLILLTSIMFANLVQAQIHIEVVKHPKFALEDSSLYISGTFNDWSPGNESYKLTRKADGVYYFDLPDSLSYFEYKFTQGGWALVEGTADGKALNNRIYNRPLQNNPNLIQVTIEGWEIQPAYTIVVNKIPENTPFDASIFVMGNFNNWNPADRNFKLRKQIDGTYRIIIYNDLQKLEYKFTRGSASSIESRPGGRILPNRVYQRKKNESKVMVDISTWEDLSAGQQLYSVYDLLLLFSVFQGILLIITIPTIHEYNREANRWLLLLIGITSLILLVKVVSNYPGVSRNLPKLQLVPDFILFIYAPLFYFYIQKLLFQSPTKTRLIYFIPVVIQFFVYTAYFLTDHAVFQDKLLDPTSELRVIRFLMASVAMTMNVYYWVLSKRSIDYYKVNFRDSNSYEQNLQYLSTVLFIQAACLLGWVATFILAALGNILSLEITSSIEISIETIWIVFSMITFFLGYFAIHEPDIFRLPQTTPALQNFGKTVSQQSEINTIEEKVFEKEEIEIENLEDEMAKISSFMEKFKPYTNPKLTLIDLSSKMKIQPHVLSKVINAGFGKNFFDYVNSYRIEEFKRRVEDPHYKNYTLLGIAFDVGFNSKTAFNRSFKKMTNQTPSSFFNTIKEY